MIKLSELIGHGAVDVRTALSTGRVTGVGLTGGRITSIGIGDACVDATAVHAFDGDVVTYDADAGEPGARPRPSDPRGARVLDVHGDLLGEIADMTITDDGFVDIVVLGDGRTVSGARLQPIGSYAAVVSGEEATR